MKYILKISLLVVVISTTLFSCKPSINTSTITSGNTDLSRYVAIGNSLTSGYADGALRKEGQTESYPNMLAQQFKLVGGGDFKIPYLTDGAGNDGSGNPRRILYNKYDSTTKTYSLAVKFDAGKPVTDLTQSVSLSGPYNLVGAPGVRAVDANWNVYSTLNPFLKRFCAQPGVSTLVTEAMRLNPTFFTMWLGNNDVLGYATAGATGQVDPAIPYTAGALSDPNYVKMNIAAAVDSLTKNGAKGVICNIPDVTSVPFFTTVPWNVIALTDQNIVNALNANYAPLGITWALGQNHIIIADPASPAGLRAATAEDLILLSIPQDSIKLAGWGTIKPVPDAYVIDKDEALVIKNHTAQYNADIATIAATKGIALADMNSYMKTLQSGVVFNGITLTPKFISGGAFSLDGVHPNNRGYALIANEILRVINAKYAAVIPYVDVTNYTGVVFPQ